MYTSLFQPITQLVKWEFMQGYQHRGRAAVHAVGQSVWVLWTQGRSASERAAFGDREGTEAKSHSCRYLSIKNNKKKSEQFCSVGIYSIRSKFHCTRVSKRIRKQRAICTQVWSPKPVKIGVGAFSFAFLYFRPQVAAALNTVQPLLCCHHCLQQKVVQDTRQNRQNKMWANSLANHFWNCTPGQTNKTHAQ